ncbi:IS5/IS1182 family transposase [Nostoc sp.]|uniref:IS5/IS1182 family transposase n=1 Tax=Nostoc sp. TaxID=1180 RepID=UPI002FF25616
MIFSYITILLDHGYHPEYLTQELERIYPEIITKIQFQLSTKPSKQEKAAQGKSGFVPAIARWVIERSNAWMERCKILVKNFERKKGWCHCQTQSLLHQAND